MWGGGGGVEGRDSWGAGGDGVQTSNDSSWSTWGNRGGRGGGGWPKAMVFGCVLLAGMLSYGVVVLIHLVHLTVTKRPMQRTGE